MFEFSRGNYEQKSVQILEATRGLSSTNLEGTHLIECLRSQLKDVTEEMERLRSERDEARRQYCRGFTDFCPNPAHDHLSLEDAAVEVAKSFGWDCFKENTDA